MITSRLLSILAAASLAGIAYAQTQPPPATHPGTAPPQTLPSSGSRLRDNQAPTNANPPAPASAARPHRSRSLRVAEAVGRAWGNMPVQTPSGKPLGSVANVVPGLNGRPNSGYVVVSGTNGLSTPVPYGTAQSMVRDGKLVLSPQRFERAPKVSQEALQNSADHAWRIKADRYWTRTHHSRKPKQP